MRSGVIARPAVVLIALGAGGCSVAAGIFKAGFWVGIVLAIVLVGGILMLMRGRR
jgi:hypothetical protein